MKQLLLCFLLYIILSCIGCQKDYYAYDIELWRNTEVWDFAKCISTKRFRDAEELLNENRYNIDYREPKFGETLLAWAVWNDNIDAVRFLVEHGANPNVHNKSNGMSPISEAAGNFGSIEILKCLLEHGGNPNDFVRENEVVTYARSNKTPLIGAAFVSLEKTKLLIEYGADANFAIEPGHTAFTQATFRTILDVLDYLLHNCEIDYKRTYIVTLDTGDTLFLKDLIINNKVACQQDSVRAKQIIDYIEKNYEIGTDSVLISK